MELGKTKKRLKIVCVSIFFVLVVFVILLRYLPSNNVVLGTGSNITIGGETVYFGIGYGEDFLFLEGEHRWSDKALVLFDDRDWGRPVVQIYVDETVNIPRTIKSYDFIFSYVSTCQESPCPVYNNVLLELYDEDGTLLNSHLLEDEDSVHKHSVAYSGNDLDFFRVKLYKGFVLSDDQKIYIHWLSSDDFQNLKNKSIEEYLIDNPSESVKVDLSWEDRSKEPFVSAKNLSQLPVKDVRVSCSYDVNDWEERGEVEFIIDGKIDPGDSKSVNYPMERHNVSAEKLNIYKCQAIKVTPVGE